MDYLSNLKYAEGSRKKRKRVGRGAGSGHGKTATRGMNGQKSRSGASIKASFEGGQMPLQRRIPKLGFTPPFRVDVQTINLNVLQIAIEKGKLNPELIGKKELFKAGLISSALKPVKILGNGEITTVVNLKVDAYSETAAKKIEAAGGKAEKE
ncbi:MAG: 50S ribosomal protein L15 [Ignavibacteriaceae bacterium]|nr:50S ribosomal protein L15 [Ignavibacteriaceae bacterium]